MRITIQSLTLLVTALGAACAMPRSIGPDHPAHPQAESAPAESLSYLSGEAMKLGSDARDGTASVEGTYTCPMHPDIVRKAPGKCPLCGMDLILEGSEEHHHEEAHP